MKIISLSNSQKAEKHVTSLLNEQELLPHGWHCSRVFVSGGSRGSLVGEEEGNDGPLFENVLVDGGGKASNVDAGGEGITIVVLDTGVLVSTHNKLPLDNSQSKPATSTRKM